MYQHPMYQTSMVETRDFWRRMAFRYRDVPTVAVYELFNEPTDNYIGNGPGSLGPLDWESWRETLEELVDIVQVYDAESISLVGGMNWGSVAVDEGRQLLVVNNMHLAFTVHMIPREEDLLASREGRELNAGYGIGGPQRGTPFAARVNMFASPMGLPCIKPPYGEMAVVDLTTRKTVWRRGLGPLQLGFPSQAGSFVTASGLIFNAGVMDGQLRAIDVLNGRVVWQIPLPGASGATSMSYLSPTAGKQYVLVTIPGTGPRRNADDPEGAVIEEQTTGTTGQVLAFALPD